MNYTIGLLDSIKTQGDLFANDDNSISNSASVEQFRTDKRKSVSFNNSVQYSNLTINDVFEDKPNLLDFNSNEKSRRINFNDNIQMIIEEDSNLNTLTYNYNKNAFQQLKSELDCNFPDEKREEEVNYREIDHEAIKGEISM